MAKFNGFNTQQRTVVDTVYRDARRCLESIVSSKLGGDAYRSVFARIMGGGDLDVVKAAEADLDKSLKAMHLRIAGLSFNVTYEPTFTNTNADMLSAQHTVTGGGAKHTSLIDELRQSSNAPSFLPMRLGPNFFNMPQRSMFEQSQVETFLHELSHHAAGTIDDDVGGACYGMTGVNRLKGLGPQRAVWNAENVGFFCVWLA